MIAILDALLEENDIDDRLVPSRFSISDELTYMETNRIVSLLNCTFLFPYHSSHIYNRSAFQIMEFTSIIFVLLLYI